MNIKKVINNHVAPLVLAASITGSVLATNVLEVHAETTDESINVESEGKGSISNYFDTLEEAKKWLEDRERVLATTYEITGKYIHECNNELIKKEIVEIDEVYDTEEEALKYLEELKKLENCSVDLTITKVGEVVEKTETIEVDKTFNTMEELNAYKDSLSSKDNLNLVVKEIPNGWKLGDEVKEADLTADSEEELEAKINEVKEKISSEETDVINYDVRVETDVKEENVPSNVRKEDFSLTFDTKEEALEFIELKKDEVKDDSDRSYEFGEISEKSVFSHNETTDINELFSTKEELEAFKFELEKQGYTLSDLEELVETHVVIENVETGKLIVNGSSKLSSNSHYEVCGNYIIIKQASGNVAVWTPSGLTGEQMTSFKESFLSGNYDPSISSSTNFVFISGSGEFDLSSIASNWGVYTIGYSDGVITLDCSSDKISHLNYGSYSKEVEPVEKTVEEYRLTGKKTIPVNKTVYELNYSLNTQEYETKKTYVASVFKTIKTKSVVYNLSGSYTETKKEEPKYNLKGKIVKSIYGTRYKAVINFKYKTKEEQKQDEDIPKTGDESNIGIYKAVLTGSVLGLVGTISTKVKKKKRQ